jgi:hypothetical protein
VRNLLLNATFSPEVRHCAEKNGPAGGCCRASARAFEGSTKDKDAPSGN